MASHSYSANPRQIIDGQNLDQQKLISLLKIVYGISKEGKNNFRVEVRCRSLVQMIQTILTAAFR